MAFKNLCSNLVLDVIPLYVFLKRSLRYMVNEHGSDEKIAQNWLAWLKMHFAKQRISATGPRLPNREAMFNKLLILKQFKMRLKMRQNQKYQPEKAYAEAEKILHEIAANVSHSSASCGGSFLTLAMEQTVFRY